ncbi:hypothetical protein P3S68_005118 [Capsicum galapagoense]
MERMSNLQNKCFFAIVILFLAGVTEINVEYITCTSKKSRCFLRPLKCPAECPSKSPSNPKAKVCYVNCNSPMCKPECRNRKANCNHPGAACLDPRFIGGDGIVFFFHGKSNEHFSLTTHGFKLLESSLTCMLSQEAAKVESWDDEVDHLKFSYNGKELSLEQGYPSIWESSESGIKVERTSSKNGAMITLPEVTEISVNVVPITKEDDRIHNYQLPSDDCFAHLDVQFRFYGLSTEVEGVLGQTYQPDFKNPAKPGVAVPVVGGEDKYRTSTLLSSKCNSCIFAPAGVMKESDPLVMDFGTLDCTGASSGGHGIVCRK